MPRSIRKLAITFAAPAAALVILGSVTWWSIHTAWFAGLVRARILATLSASTGGRVESGPFTFDPATLTAGISQLVIHGTEPVGSPPLLSVASVRIGYKILSLWRRDIDLQSLAINQPEFHLIVDADGTTNIPQPKRRRKQDAISQLLELKVKRLEVVEGLMQINDRRLPFGLTSQDIGLVLDYNYGGPSYGLSLESNAVKAAFGKTEWPHMRIAAQGRLFRDHADIEHCQLVTADNSSTITLSGKIQQFAHLSADANVEANLAMNELAQLADINQQLRNGRATASGSAHFDSAGNQFTFNGKAAVQGVDYVSPAFTLRNISGTADMLADNKGMLLRHAQADARGAHFAGEGAITAYHSLEVDGHVSQVALKEVGSYLTKQPFPWSGTASGAAHASAKLSYQEPDLIIRAKVEIEPGKTGIPASGDLDVTYYARTQKVEFGDSVLRLPNSTANFQGALDSDLALTAQTTNLADLLPLMPIVGAPIGTADLPDLSSGGSAHFEGSLHDLIRRPALSGDLAVGKFKFHNYDWDALKTQFTASSRDLSIPHFELSEADARLSGSASAQLADWRLGKDSPVRVDAHFTNLNLLKTAAMFGNSTLPVIQGVASGNINLHGSWNNPHGAANFRVTNLDAYGEQLNQIQFDAQLDGARLQLNKGRVQSGLAVIGFSGSYEHSPANWSTGNIALKADSNGFPLASLLTVRKYVPALNGRAEVHLDALGKLNSNSFEPFKIDGNAQLQSVSVGGRDLGNASIHAVTQGNSIDFSYTGDFRNTKFHGSAEAQLTAGTPIRGSLQLDRISLATLKSLASEAKLVLPLDGYLDGGIAFDGLLEEPALLRAQATIQHLQISSKPSAGVGSAVAPDIVLSNKAPIVIDVAGGVLHIAKFQIEGRDTSVNITGSAPFLGGEPVDIKAVGTADLALFTLFDPNVRSSGSSELIANVSGPMSAPSVSGSLQLRNGSFFMANLPNGLSDVNGSVIFSRNRATIQRMSGHSGGGDISVGGSLSFGEGSPLVYHLEGSARNVRVRYANSISVTGNSDLRLSGTSSSGLLSGNLIITRVVFTPNADAGNLLAAASSSASSPADQDDFISGLHMDVGIESAPNLQVSTNLSRDVEAEIQLRLRGTPDHPIVLGNITANQGDIKIFGTRFTLNRGEVSFLNSIRIEPVLDLDLQTEARGITVDITVSGTPSKLNFNYRSDPPLQPRDIIALLTVGQAPQVGTTANAQSGSDVSALSSGVNSVLGQAISPVSNRLSKLFGIANIRIDPFVQGITNTPQARLSVEQQISRNVTVTYVTNLSETSEQIFRFEWALSRQFSIVALRDDNGEFGIDFQYKKRFK
jgi:translocation and assembly module TamB